jgi:ankyrin repeat protein
MSEFLLRPNTLNISLIRAIEDDDDKDNKYLKEVLARKDVDVNALGANTWNTLLTTAIIMATNTNNVDKVRLLLETGRVTNINKTDGFGRSPIYVASENGNYEIVKLLLENGADPKLLPKKYPRNSTGFGLKPKKSKSRKTNKRKKNSKRKKE